MDSKNFGILFKDFRERKGFKQINVAEGIVSVQFLRRFEKGESDIKLSNFYSLLNRINVSFEEFMYELEIDSIDYNTEFVEKKLDNIIIKNDVIALDRLIRDFKYKYDETGEKKFLHYYIVAKIVCNYCFKSNYKIELEDLFSYLNKCETWGKHEYLLANYSVSVFNDKQLFTLGEISFYGGIENRSTRHYAFDFIFHVCQELLRRGLDNEALDMITLFKDKVEIKPILQYLSFYTGFEFLEGLIEGKKGDPKGYEKSRKIIEFFNELVGYKDYANKMQGYYISFYNGE